jgi:hypothetical protein
MTWGRTSLPDNLPELENYADALYRYSKTEPLRAGKDKGLVPLGWNRRYKRSQILKVETLQGNAIFCRFHRTDVVKFYENGMVEFGVGGWDSPTTLMFLQGVFGMAKFARYKGKIYYKQLSTGKFFLIGKNGLRIDETGTPIDPTPEVAKVLNRARWKDLLQKLKPFSVYASDMSKLLEPKSGHEMSGEFDALVRTYGEEYWRGLLPKVQPKSASRLGIPYLPISAREIRYNRNNIAQSRTEFINRVLEASQTNDAEKMYPLLFTIQASASEQRWTGNGYVSECNPARVRKYLMELLKFEFCEGLFDDVVQPLGEFVADSNAKYFVNRKTT